jgi:hypothetical protein
MQENQIILIQKQKVADYCAVLIVFLVVFGLLLAFNNQRKDTKKFIQSYSIIYLQADNSINNSFK